MIVLLVTERRYYSRMILITTMCNYKVIILLITLAKTGWVFGVSVVVRANSR